MKLPQLLIVTLCLFLVVPAWADESATVGKKPAKPAAKAVAKSQPASKAPEIDQNVVAVFEFNGPLTEAPPNFEFGANMQPKRSFYELLRRFKKAEQDKHLKAVVLVFDGPKLGLAQMQEIQQAIGRLREAGKDVHCYLEQASMGIYTMATAATKIWATPVGEIDFAGIHMEHAYYKGLLDKLGLEADVEHVGSYKSAGEPFTRTGPSDEAKEMHEWLAKDIFDQMIGSVAKNRNLTPEKVRELVDRGPFIAKEARLAKLIDETAYAEDFTDAIKSKYDVEEFDHDYGAKKSPELDFSNIFSLFSSFGKLMAEGKSSDKPAIGIVYVDGMIVSGSAEGGLFGDSGEAASTTLRRELAKARDDDDIKAVVLRVDSPGGSSLASDIIWHATQELKDNKPFIVSMGNVAASGGYYVSCASPTIFADPGTITGSIGVIGGKLVTKGLWDWLGVSFYRDKIGENADMYRTDQKFDDRQRALVKKMMLEIYGEFTDRVTKGRGKRLKKDINEIAGGRVYTGRQALELGLVDKLGGLYDAIQFAADKADITDYEIRLLPEPKNFIDMLVQNLSGEKQKKDEGEITLGMQRGSWTLQAPAIRDLLPALQHADPDHFQTVLRSLMRIELLGRERALLCLPAEINMR